MGILYLPIKRQIALLSAQLKGNSQAALESAYSGLWVDALDGAEIPISAVKNTILNIEAELAHIIGSDVFHPYRSYIYGRSEDLATLAGTPFVDNTDKPFVGQFDSAADSATNRPLTQMPVQSLEDYADPFFDNVELWNYDVRGNTIIHTRPLAYLQGCIWDRATQSVAFDDDAGESPLPEILANTLIAGTMGNTIQTGWTDGVSAASAYQNIYQQGLQILREGASGQVNLPLASQMNQAAG